MEPKGYEQWYGNWTYVLIYPIVRHPQYLGLILIIIGLNVQWPTFPTLVMASILILIYLRLTRVEERELQEEFGIGYEVYRKSVHPFIPKVIRHRQPVKTGGHEARE